MDNDTILKQFNEIENRVESLISRCSSLGTANSDLAAKVENLESKLREKEAAENQDSEIRTLIRSKIDNLLERLDGITEVEK
ncbi:MAG: cell division protein ZapB [Deltaproteobacteria bacterium]|nr:cell division protein ZapB [Deltaproteobacteria bacterium]